MNVSREILHVTLNSALRARWLLVSFAGLVAFAAWRGALSPSFVRPFCIDGCSANIGAVGDVAALLVFLLGFTIAGIFIQQDSPIRYDAFWKIQPARPASVFCAKLLLISATVVVPVVLGEAAGVLGLGLSVTDSWPVIVSATRFFVCSLACAIAMASITRDLRSFTLASVGVVIATGMFWIAIANTNLHLRALYPYWPSLSVVLILIAIGSVATMYISRTSSVLRIMPIGAAFATAISSSYAAVKGIETRVQPNAIKISRQNDSIAQLVVKAHLDGRALSIITETHAPPVGHRYRLINASATLVTPRGDSILLPIQTAERYPEAISGVDRSVIYLRAAADSTLPAARQGAPVTATIISSMLLPDSVLQWVASNKVTVSVSGFIEDQVRTLLLDLPAQPGTYKRKATTISIAPATWKTTGRALQHGLRLSGVTALEYNPVYSVLQDRVDDSVDEEFVDVAGNISFVVRPAEDGVHFSLLKNGGRDTLPLQSTGRGAASFSMVLPVFGFASAYGIYAPPQAEGRETNLDDWMQTGRLIVTRWRYNSHGNVHATVVLSH